MTYISAMDWSMIFYLAGLGLLALATVLTFVALFYKFAGYLIEAAKESIKA